MGRDIFGLSRHGIEKRMRLETEHADKLAEVFSQIVDKIKNNHGSDGWYRVVMFNAADELLNSFSYTAKTNLMFYLRRHPNIISRLSDRETKNISDNMKPYIFKWVSEEEKNSLGIHANYFRNIDDELLDYIQKSVSSPDVSFTDILSVLEFLISSGSGKWFDTSTLNIGVRSGVLIENVRCALNELLKMRLVVLAFTEGSYRKGKWQQHVKLTFNPKDYEEALIGKEINAVKTVGAKDALNEKFQFTVLNYFYSLLDKTKIKEEKFTPVFLQQKSEPKISLFTPIETKEEVKEPEPVVVPEEKVEVPSPQLSQVVDEIKSCVTSFVGIAESLSKNEEKKLDALNSIIQMNNQKQQEIDELQNQITGLKKLLNQRDRDKYQTLKTVQDVLNMMMGQIITETDNFASIPRHQLDEHNLAKYKADVIKIAVKTAADIQKLFSGNNSR